MAADHESPNRQALRDENARLDRIYRDHAVS